jgi:hypothetical protein
LLALLFFASCSKNTGPPPEYIPLKTVYAGEYDESYIYYKYQEPLEIRIKWDEQNLYGAGKDSIDLDFNGKYDIWIHLNILNEDSLHLIQGYPDPFPGCFLKVGQGTEVATYTISYPIGHGQYSKASYADTLSQGERIDRITEWYGNPTGGIAMWATHPGGFAPPTYGGWYDAKSVKYLGIKQEGRFGWIKVDATDTHNPKIVSYALRK